MQTRENTDKQTNKALYLRDDDRYPKREDTYSFILRMRLDSAGTGTHQRPHFKLEDVTAGREWRFTDFESAADCLASRVQQIISGPDSA